MLRRGISDLCRLLNIILLVAFHEHGTEVDLVPTLCILLGVESSIYRSCFFIFLLFCCFSGFHFRLCLTFDLLVGRLSNRFLFHCLFFQVFRGISFFSAFVLTSIIYICFLFTLSFFSLISSFFTLSVLLILKLILMLIIFLRLHDCGGFRIIEDGLGKPARCVHGVCEGRSLHSSFRLGHYGCLWLRCRFSVGLSDSRDRLSRCLHRFLLGVFFTISIVLSSIGHGPHHYLFLILFLRFRFRLPLLLLFLNDVGILLLRLCTKAHQCCLKSIEIISTHLGFALLDDSGGSGGYLRRFLLFLCLVVLFLGGRLVVLPGVVGSSPVASSLASASHWLLLVTILTICLLLSWPILALAILLLVCHFNFTFNLIQYIFL